MSNQYDDNAIDTTKLDEELAGADTAYAKAPERGETPPGEYICIIKEAKLGLTKEKKKPQVSLDLVIMRPLKMQKQHIFFNMWFTLDKTPNGSFTDASIKSLGRLKSDLKLFGKKNLAKLEDNGQEKGIGITEGSIAYLSTELKTLAQLAIVVKVTHNWNEEKQTNYVNKTVTGILGYGESCIPVATEEEENEFVEMRDAENAAAVVTDDDIPFS